LQKTDLYDRSLVIVVADHGVSFKPGERRRGITPGNVGDIGPVPLIVKRPNQERGRVVDRSVRTTDILPTIADVLGEPVPWRADGRSLFDSAGDRSDVAVAQRVGDSVRATAAAVIRARDESAAQMNSLFRMGLYAFGPHRALVGTYVAGADAADATASIDGETLLASVDPRSALTPSHVTGTLDGAPTGTWLAVAVNGRVAGVTRAFESSGSVRFSAFLPESAFQAGANDIEVFAIRDRTLERLGGTGGGEPYALDDGQIASGERTIRIDRGDLEGEVEDWYFERDAVRFGGWAGDVETRKPAEKVLVFGDGELLHSGTPSVGREDLGRRYPGLGRSGFVFDLPRKLVGDGGGVSLRFFALRGDRATELTYASDFPWSESP
jgi:hypothetical protein